MDITTIPLDMWITFATVIATIIFGQLSKKYDYIEKKRIPLQNIAIGLIVCLVQFFITKDINIAVAMSGLISGGTYDLAKCLNQVINEDKKEV